MNNGGDRMASTSMPNRIATSSMSRRACVSPANGLVPAIIGTKRAINLDVGGKGSWTRWRGRRRSTSRAGRRRGSRWASIAAATGLQGQWAPAQFLTGKLQRLTAPLVNIRGDATLKNRILDGQLTAGSPELRAVAKGALDLAGNRYRGMRLGIDLLQPPALFTNMTGKSVRMVWTLDGPFGTADYSYRLTSPHVQFDNNGFDELRAEGRGRLGPWPMRVPIRLQRARDHRSRRRRRSDARQPEDRRAG